MHSKVHHPDLLRIPEILSRFGKGSEDGLSGLLLPNGFAPARWCEPDPQVFAVPVRQRIFNSCLRRRSRIRWLFGVLCRHGEFVLGQNEAGPTRLEVIGAFASSFHPPPETS